MKKLLITGLLFGLVGCQTSTPSSPTKKTTTVAPATMPEAPKEAAKEPAKEAAKEAPKEPAKEAPKTGEKEVPPK